MTDLTPAHLVLEAREYAGLDEYPGAVLIIQLADLIEKKAEQIEQNAIDYEQLRIQFNLASAKRAEQAEQIAGLTSERDDLAETAAEYFVEMRKAESEAADLRKELQASMAMHEQARLLANSALGERDALLKVVQDAPHEWTCPARQGEHLTCLCWKSKALAEKETM